MKDTKYKILAYFDNQSYRKLFNEINSDYAENLQILLHNLSLFSYDVLIIGVILYKENILHPDHRSPGYAEEAAAGIRPGNPHGAGHLRCVHFGSPDSKERQVSE